MKRTTSECGVLLAVVCVIGASSASADDSPRRSRKSPVKLSPSTTFLTKPLDENGDVDYLEALNRSFSKDVTPANNAAVLLWKACGTKRVIPKNRPEFYRRLGITPLPLRGTYFVTSSEFYAKLKGDARDKAREKIDNELEACSLRPWSSEKFRTVARWLKQNEKPMRLLAAASRKPQFYSPLISDLDDQGERRVWNAYLPACQRVNEFVRAFAARAMLHLNQGRIDLAMRDAMVLHRFARRIERNPFIIPSLVAVRVDRFACGIGVAAAQSGKLTRAQVREWRKQVRGLPAWKPAAEKLDFGERCAFLANIPPIIRHGMKASEAEARKDAVGRAIENAILQTVDWNEVHKYANRWMDRAVRIARIREPWKRRPAVREFGDEIAKLKSDLRVSPNVDEIRLTQKALISGASTWMGKLVVSTSMPATQQAVYAEDERRTRLELTDLAFALAEYRLVHGRYPLRLASLAPKHVARIPLDRFSGQPLIYRAYRGGYVLYSIGRNFRDNFGISSDEPGSTEDDIVVRAR